MVKNPFDETLKAGQAGQQLAAGIASLPGKLRDDPNQEYRSFQVRANEPDARALERYAFDVSREHGQHPMNIDIGLHPNWEERQGSMSSLSSAVHPFHPLNVSNKRKIDPVTNTDAMGDYTDYLYNRIYQNSINKEKQRIKNENVFKAGIMNPDLAETEMAKSWKRKFQEGLVDPWLEPLLEGLGVNLQPDPEDLITVDELPVTPLEGSIMPEDETEDLLDEYETEDLLDEDEGYFWEPFGGTQVVGTTEDKWGQLVRDGVVNPGDSLNPLQIDQLYNQYYEGGAGDMDQFGVV